MDKENLRYRLNRLKRLENLLEWAEKTADGAEITIKLKHNRYSLWWDNYVINNVESTIDGDIMIEILETFIQKEQEYIDGLLKAGE